MGRKNVTEVGVTDVGYHTVRVKLRVIEDIVEFDSELNSHALVNLRVLIELEVPIVQSRSPKGIPGGIPIRSSTRRGPCSGNDGLERVRGKPDMIPVAIERAPGIRVVNARDLIGPIPAREI